MTADSDSFRGWLRQEILQVLKKKAPEPPFIIWCDPERVWVALLKASAESDSFELWTDDIHELVLRDRFCREPRSPRVIWLPVAKEDLTYFKVFEFEADDVREWSLPEALSMYGVDLPSGHLAEIKAVLPTHAIEWIDRPLKYWKDNL